MAEQKDLYDILGVPHDADEKAIKNAYRKLAMKYHPDRNPSPDATTKFRELANAYAVLHDPKKRAEYDARGHAGVAGYSPEDLFGGIDFEDLFGGLGFGFGQRGGTPFDDFFRNRTRPLDGADLRVRLEVPLKTVMNGGKEIVHIQHPVTCPQCNGSGAKKGTSPRICEDCGGSGKLIRAHKKGNVSFQQVSPCPKCHGSGRYLAEPCPRCQGRGEYMKDEKLSITVPKGVEEGMILKIAGHGMPALEQGGKPGDLLVSVYSAPDKRFERQETNLWHVKKITVTDAVLGAEITVPTLDGKLKVKVPAGTQPDAVLRLHGKGLPAFERSGRGDMLVRIAVQLPKNLSEKERDLYEQLHRLNKR